MPRYEYGRVDLFSSLEEFNNVVSVIFQLIKERKIKILFGFESDVKIEIDDLAFSKFDIQKDLFNKILDRELIPILEVVLSNSEEGFIASQVRTKNFKSGKEKLISEIKSKIEILSNTIIDEELKNRYIIKATTKLPKIRKICWEINNKTYDNNIHDLNVKYATLSIKTCKILDDDNLFFKYFPFIQTENPLEEIIFDCDKFDIDNIISILKQISDKL